MGIKHYQEKNARAMEKELAQSDIPVKRKIQKTIRKYHFHEIWYFRMVFWIFLLTGMTFDKLITFLTIENNSLNIHSDSWIKSDRDRIRNSCNVLEASSSLTWDKIWRAMINEPKHKGRQISRFFVNTRCIWNWNDFLIFVISMINWICDQLKLQNRQGQLVSPLSHAQYILVELPTKQSWVPPFVLGLHYASTHVNYSISLFD